MRPSCFCCSLGPRTGARGGNIGIDDQWLQPYLDGTKGDIARYFVGG